MVLDYKDFQITENFNIKEFHCKDGTRVPYGYIQNCIYIATLLQLLRDCLGVPIVINSAYRTYNHNLAIGGKKGSNHLQGLAVDIRQNLYDNKKFYKIIEELIAYGILPAGELIYYETFIHYAPYIFGNYYPIYDGKYWKSPQKNRAEYKKITIKYNEKFA